MKPEHVTETARVITEANNGNWIPAAVVGSLFMVIIMLLLYVYNKDRKTSYYRHKDTEGIQNKLIANNDTLKILINRHDVIIDQHEKKLNRIESNT
jgi:hypothetical protein